MSIVSQLDPAEAERDRLRKQAALAESLNTISTFFGMSAHELLGLIEEGLAKRKLRATSKEITAMKENDITR